MARPAYHAVLAAAAVAALAPGCCRGGGSGRASISLERGVVSALAVPGDVPAKIVRGSAGRRAMVYLPPMCADPMLTFATLGPAAAGEGTVIMLVGDQPCPNTPWFHFSHDLGRLTARIDRALAASAAMLPGEMDTQTVTVLGYSEGAARAEEIVHSNPGRFPRVLLIGAPHAPAPSGVGKVRAVATMAGDLDRRDLMLVGVKNLQGAGVPARFFLLPHAHHGEMGPEGGRVVKEALAWLHATAP